MNPNRAVYHFRPQIPRFGIRTVWTPQTQSISSQRVSGHVEGTPVFFVPSYAYPVAVTEVPETVQYQNWSTRSFSKRPYYNKPRNTPTIPTHPPRTGCLIDNRVLNRVKNFGYCTGPLPNNSSEKDKSAVLDLELPELYETIIFHIEKYTNCRISWLNRLIAKSGNLEEFNLAKNAFFLYQKKLLSTTPETGTLLLKAACRAEIPEQALAMLKDFNIRIFPTLGGIHYLMINFSIRNDTKRVLETFEVCKLRKLNPNSRTYHIIIRECVDNNLIEEALEAAEECKMNNIIPNRVTYNILMNGLRKVNRAEDMVALRKQMDENKIEINDTTVKFTSLAYTMLGSIPKAIEEFTGYANLDSKVSSLCEKFLEIEGEQRKYVKELFVALKEHGVAIPSSVFSKLE